MKRLSPVVAYEYVGWQDNPMHFYIKMMDALDMRLAFGGSLPFLVEMQHAINHLGVVWQQCDYYMKMRPIN